MNGANSMANCDKRYTGVHISNQWNYANNTFNLDQQLNMTSVASVPMF